MNSPCIKLPGIQELFGQFRYLDVKWEDYQREIDAFGNKFSRSPYRQITRDPLGTFVGSQAWTSILIISLNNITFRLRIDYSWYLASQIAPPMQRLASLIDLKKSINSFIGDVRSRKSAEFQLVGYELYYVRSKNEMRTFDNEFTFSGETIDRILEWLEHIRDRIPRDHEAYQINL